ncbi:MAG TPA: hypothetical protein VLA74_10310 [Nitrososphaeraceae archaeon]|nr:hypothetical protein [Nitrososphaeraceae archaeon]
MPHRYSKIKSIDIVTEVDSRSIIKEHSFRLNPISKLFCSSFILILLIGGTGVLALSSQDVHAQQIQEGEVSVSEDNDANSENSVIDEGGVSIADICGDNIDNDADGQMDDLDLDGCIPAYEETVTEGETTTTATGVEGEVATSEDDATATGVEGEVATPTDSDADPENSVIDEGEGVSIADICGDNIDNDSDGQMDDLDPEGCVLNSKIYDTDELMELSDKISKKLEDLANTVGAPEPGTTIKETEFHNAIIGFSANLKRQVLDSVSYSEPMPIPLKITLESLRLWIDDPGNQWGEGWWDSNDLDMSAPCYVTVPASQNKCNVYIAEVIFLATGITFPVIESEEELWKYFPYRAKDWGDTKKTIHILLL